MRLHVVPLIGGMLAFEIFGGIALPGQIRKSKERDYPLPANVFGCLKLSKPRTLGGRARHLPCPRL
jgi:hypothetical protein